MNSIDRWFEKFNISIYKVLASILPYLTPFPVASLTSVSASSFLGFTGFTPFIFVLCLEGLGLWFTSLLVDAVIEFIRSRNFKTLFLVLLFGSVVWIYVDVLVELNVTLKSNTSNFNPALSRVITLLCYLPLLSGIGNGYYKWKLEQRDETKEKERQEADKEERRYQDKREDKLKGKMIAHGMNPVTQYQQLAPVAIPTKESKKKDDWRLLTYEEKREVIFVLKPNEIMKKYGVKRATAYNWKSRKLD